MALTVAQEIALYETALTDILESGQGIGIGGRSLTRADLKEINRRLRELRAIQSTRTSGPIRVGLPRLSS